jgi:2,3-diketo-5-methylthio-1-phosphopentane phosphatase
VTIDLAASRIRLILLDIEGTTTPMAFVHERLFPYARVRLRAWLTSRAGTDERRDVMALLRAEHAADAAQDDAVPAWPADPRDDIEPAVAYLEWLMDRDRKSPALKRLQGLIWEDGYQAGELRGEVFADVPDALRRWRAAGIDLAIYSSGSELAQRRLFASTVHGDLTPLISAFFDTAVGAKISPASYQRIVAALGHAPGEALFVSDVTRELRAAEEAGCQVVLSIRPGNPDQPHSEAFAHVSSFDRIR